jgi:hypothetical protein
MCPSSNEVAVGAQWLALTRTNTTWSDAPYGKSNLLFPRFLNSETRYASTWPNSQRRNVRSSPESFRSLFSVTERIRYGGPDAPLRQIVSRSTPTPHHHDLMHELWLLCLWSLLWARVRSTQSLCPRLARIPDTFGIDIGCVRSPRD